MKQKVDPFIPVTKHRPLPAGQYGSQYFAKTPREDSQQSGSEPLAAKTPVPVNPDRPLRPMRTMDISVAPHTRHRVVQPRPSVTQQNSQTEAASIVSSPRRKKASRRRHWPKLTMQLILFIVLAGAAGFLLQSVTAGESIIAVYALYAIIRHVESRITFILALIALVSTALLSTFNGDSTLANNFAVYAFLLLVVGTISMGIEMRRSGTLSKS